MNNPETSPPITPPLPPPIVSDHTEFDSPETPTSSDDSEDSNNGADWAEEESTHPYNSDEESVSTHGLDWTIQYLEAEGTDNGESTSVLDIIMVSVTKISVIGYQADT